MVENHEEDLISTHLRTERHKYFGKYLAIFNYPQITLSLPIQPHTHFEANLHSHHIQSCKGSEIENQFPV